MRSKNFPKGGKVHPNSAKIFRQLFYIASGHLLWPFMEFMELPMVVRGTWNRARACRAVARASFEGSLKKILKGLEH